MFIIVKKTFEQYTPININTPQPYSVSVQISIGEWVHEVSDCKRRTDEGLGQPPTASDYLWSSLLSHCILLKVSICSRYDSIVGENITSTKIATELILVEVLMSIIPVSDLNVHSSVALTRELLKREWRIDVS